MQYAAHNQETYGPRPPPITLVNPGRAWYPDAMATTLADQLTAAVTAHDLTALAAQLPRPEDLTEDLTEGSREPGGAYAIALAAAYQARHRPAFALLLQVWPRQLASTMEQLTPILLPLVHDALAEGDLAWLTTVVHAAPSHLGRPALAMLVDEGNLDGASLLLASYPGMGHQGTGLAQVLSQAYALRDRHPASRDLVVLLAHHSSVPEHETFLVARQAYAEGEPRLGAMLFGAVRVELILDWLVGDATFAQAQPVLAHPAVQANWPQLLRRAHLRHAAAVKEEATASPDSQPDRTAERQRTRALYDHLLDQTTADLAARLPIGKRYHVILATWRARHLAQVTDPAITRPRHRP